MDEVLIALSVSAASDPNAQKALEQLPNLKGCQAHTSVMVSDVDRKLFMKLSIQATFEAKYENNSVIFPKKVYGAVYEPILLNSRTNNDMISPVFL